VWVKENKTCPPTAPSFGGFGGSSAEQYNKYSHFFVKYSFKYDNVPIVNRCDTPLLEYHDCRCLSAIFISGDSSQAIACCGSGLANGDWKWN
jgi:hypothetical protein